MVLNVLQIPGVRLSDQWEVESRILCFALLNITANIIWRTKNLPEIRIDNDLWIAGMVLKNEPTCFKGPSQRTDNNIINMSAFHFLSGLETLLNSMFSNFHIEVILAELCSLILLGFHILLAILIFNLSFDKVVSGLGVTEEVNHGMSDFRLLIFLS